MVSLLAAFVLPIMRWLNEIEEDYDETVGIALDMAMHGNSRIAGEHTQHIPYMPGVAITHANCILLG